MVGRRGDQIAVQARFRAVHQSRLANLVARSCRWVVSAYLSRYSISASNLFPGAGGFHIPLSREHLQVGHLGDLLRARRGKADDLAGLLTPRQDLWHIRLLTPGRHLRRAVSRNQASPGLSAAASQRTCPLVKH